MECPDEFRHPLGQFRQVIIGNLSTTRRTRLIIQYAIVRQRFDVIPEPGDMTCQAGKSSISFFLNFAPNLPERRAPGWHLKPHHQHILSSFGRSIARKYTPDPSSPLAVVL
jgi:hypothetical protein